MDLSFQRYISQLVISRAELILPLRSLAFTDFETQTALHDVHRVLKSLHEVSRARYGTVYDPHYVFALTTQSVGERDQEFGSGCQGCQWRYVEEGREKS